MIIPVWARATAVLALAVLLVGAGWAANGWRLNAAHEREIAAIRDKARDDLHAAEGERDALADRLRVQDEAAAVKLGKAKDENASLLDRVNAGAVRLRVAARCPNVLHVPEAAASAGVDSGAGVELDPAARSTYRALRNGIRTVEVKLEACQSQLRERVPQSDTSE